MFTSLGAPVKGQHRADACRMFTEPSGPLMVIPVARSDPGHGPDAAYCVVDANEIAVVSGRVLAELLRKLGEPQTAAQMQLT